MFIAFFLFCFGVLPYSSSDPQGHCDVEVDVDYPNNDLDRIYPLDLDSCKATCLDNQLCKGYVFSYNTCYLKEKMENPTYYANAYAGKCYRTSPSGSSSLSGGSILLILFFVSLSIYLLAGAAFMKVKRNALGAEVIPNKTFWASLPGLVKDGLKLLIYPCSKRRSYENMA